MEIKMAKVFPKSVGEARSMAIEWQAWASTQSLSYGELSEWSQFFRRVATEYDLREEFVENAIL